ncbi:MAG: hypothetical protein DRI57_31120 [Deltaproteobacteria bacterium]|nr:MAG: hypothetical protein DRI57_31120 [Deltaproteobacteria bacterium]
MYAKRIIFFNHFIFCKGLGKNVLPHYLISLSLFCFFRFLISHVVKSRVQAVVDLFTDKLVESIFDNF